MSLPFLTYARTLALFAALTGITGATFTLPLMAHGEGMPPGRPGTPKHVDRTITLAIKDKDFGPKTLRVRPHETVRFVIKNHDSVSHTFILGIPGAKKGSSSGAQTVTATFEGRDFALSPSTPWSVDIPAGTSRGLIWTFESASEVMFSCSHPEHDGTTMRGTISVMH